MNPLEIARRLWRAEPVRCAGYLAALVVAVSAKLGLVVDEQDVSMIALSIVPIILGVEAARREVIPVTTVANMTVPPNDDKGDRNAKQSRPR